MPPVPRGAQMRVVSGQEWLRVGAALREINAGLPGKLRTQIRKSADGAVRKAKAHVRGMDVEGRHGSTGLRRRVARGTRARASLNKGLRIVTSTPQGQEMLPRGLDSEWEHPVFGNEHIMVTQEGGSWFIEPIADEHPEIMAKLNAILVESARFIAMHGVKIPASAAATTGRQRAQSAQRARADT